MGRQRAPELMNLGFARQIIEFVGWYLACHEDTRHALCRALPQGKDLLSVEQIEALLVCLYMDIDDIMAAMTNAVNCLDDEVLGISLVRSVALPAGEPAVPGMEAEEEFPILDDEADIIDRPCDEDDEALGDN